MTFVESLRCVFQCPFVSFPMNVTIPFSACKHEERDNVQFSLIVTIDFKNHVVSGDLYMEKLDTIASLRIESKFQLESNSVVSTVWYTCSISDYCNYEFLNELITNKLVEFNATSASVHQKLIDLLYTSTPSPTGIQCVNGSCSSNSFCQALLTNLVMSNYNHTTINGSLPCVDLSSTDPFLEVTQIFFPFKSEANIINIRCNTKECNSNETVAEVYRLILNDFVIPLNYSILDINGSFLTTTPLPSTASFLYSLYNLISFVVMFLFFSE